jgi:hypothetical protein
MSDLIRREDALALRDKLADIIGALPMSSIYSALSEYRNAIRALPAVQPHVNETPKSEHVPGDVLTPATKGGEG